MELTKLTSRLSMAPQICAEEVQKIAAASFRSIICNRPDGEEQGQPTAEEIGAAVRTVAWASPMFRRYLASSPIRTGSP